MKATINGITVEGTPQEIAIFCQLERVMEAPNDVRHPCGETTNAGICVHIVCN